MFEENSVKRKYVRPAASTWAEIEGLWETGDATLQDLEERYGLSRRSLQSHFAKRNVVKGAKAAQLAASVKQQVFADNLADEDLTTSRAKETREAAYRNAVVVENLIMGQLAVAQKDPSQALRAASALKALSLAAAGLERIHSLKWRALGLDKDSIDPDEMPVLVFEDLTVNEIKAIQEGHEEDDLGESSSCTTIDDEDEVVVIDNTNEPPRDRRRAEALAKKLGGRLVRGALPDCA